MVDNKSNIKEVLGRIIRNTKLQDTAYIPDLFVWTAEACADMETKWTLTHEWYDQEVHFHKAELPCGLQRLQHVEYKGMCLYERNISKSAALVRRYPPADSQMWISSVHREQTPGGGYTYVQDQASVPAQYCPDEWWQHDGPGYIATSFHSGMVRLHYLSIPVDKEGYPLIVDHYDYKEAIYWYCRKKLVESGWDDPVFKWEHSHMQYCIHADRAKAAIKYPSVGRAEQSTDLVTLIPPQNYYESYGNIQADPYEGNQSEYPTQIPTR